jgi:hypothetical protein
MSTVWMVLLVLIVTALLWWGGCSVGKDNGANPQEPEEEQGVYYVSPGGNDADSGEPGAPWRTVQQALNTLQPGEKVVIRAGIYAEALYMNRSGSEGRKIYIEGVSAETVILDGSGVERDLFFLEGCRYVEISGVTLRRAPRAGLRLSDSHHIDIHHCRFADNGRWGLFSDFSDDTTVRDCDVYGSGEEHGIYISNSSDRAVIAGNTVHHNYACGIQINADPSMGGDGISSDCLVENNIVYENGRGGGAAINLSSVRDSLIQNNMIYKNYAGGIAAWDDDQGSQWGSQNLTIIHNTVYFRPAEGRWAVSLKNGSSGAGLYNNILVGGRRGGFEFNSGCLAGIELDYNIYFRAGSGLPVSDEDDREYTLSQWQARGYDLHSMTVSAQDLFMNIPGGDFHLRHLCRAVDGGADRNLAYDFEGDTRPKGAGPDIGADERE